MLENMVSKSALQYRDFASQNGKTEWLDKSMDIGAIVVQKGEEPQKVFETQMENGIQFLSPKEASVIAKEQKARAYYIVGHYGKPRDWEVKDCFADFSGVEVTVKDSTDISVESESAISVAS